MVVGKGGSSKGKRIQGGVESRGTVGGIAGGMGEGK